MGLTRTFSRLKVWGFRFLSQRHPGRLLLFCASLVLLPIVSFLIFFLYCEFRIDSHLRSQEWTLPSTIYADGPVLSQGMPLSSRSVASYFQRLNYHKHEAGEVLGSAGEYMVDGNKITFRKRQLFLEEAQSPIVSVVFGEQGVERIANESTGNQIDSYSLEPVPIRDLVGGDWEKRILVSYNEIPVQLIHAVIAIEDRRFYDHHGIDYQAILRALWNDIREKRLSEGGSTITQQLVKNSYLSPEKSLWRKFNEAMMAWILETRLSKEKILELYLNEIYLGQRGSMSLNGVGETSRLFFRKDVRHLTVPEAAMIAGMIKAPNPYNPYRHPEEALQRRNTVLKEMEDQGYLTAKEFERYSMSPLTVYPLDDRINLAPYFGDLVKQQLLSKFGEDTLYTKNLHIFTTLDLEMQQAAEESLAEGLRNIDRLRFRKTGEYAQGCLIAIEPKTGYIRAFVGGRNYSKSQFNRIIQALRQPGSVFKPVVYAAALEQTFSRRPRIFTPASLVTDGPWILQYSTDKTWEPKNYDGRFHGIVTLRTALAQSMNVATARVAVAVGLEKIAALGHNLGFETVQPYPSIALGTFEASPWQVAQAYSVFANAGMKTELQSVRDVTDAEGKMLNQPKVQATRVLHPQTAFIITSMMRSVIMQGTGASVRQYGFNRPAAGKTGTTDDFRDAWFVGYTPDLLCVVWTGYDDNTPLGMTGAQAALPIWANFMRKATAEMPFTDFAVPSGIVVRSIDPITGQLSTGSCPETIQEVFISGTEPHEYCSYHTDGYAGDLPLSSWFSNRGQGDEYKPQAFPDGQRDGFLKRLKRKFHGFWN